ncbi:MAG: LysR substrate-binding domain-containing protein [Polyangiaceae bacterium]
MLFAPHPVTLRQLQYVVAVANRKSFRKAAQDCHVSQPSLSAQVAQAEDILGIRLFERNPRSVTITSAGQGLVERARALCVGADELVEDARRLADPFAGRLRLGVIPTVAPYLLPEIAPILRERYPKLTVLWSEDKTQVLVDRMARGELDGAILALEAEIGKLSQVVLGSDPFVFAASPSHPLAASDRPLKPQELDAEAVLLLDDGHCFRKQVLSFCARSGADEAGYRATSLATLVQMAAGGIGVTLLPSLALPVENRLHALRVRPFTPKVPSRTLALCWRPQSALEVALSRVGQTLRTAYQAMARHKRA